MTVKNLVLVMTFVMAVPGAAAAQQTLPESSDPLIDICTGFLAQSGQGVSGDAAKLCSCLTRETQARLSRREIEDYSRATSNGEMPPDAVMQKVMGIATHCLTQAQP